MRALCCESGVPPEPRYLELKVGVPLIEAASLEENDAVQELFAKLLVNATDARSPIEAKRAFVSMLQDFGPLEARLLQAIYLPPPLPDRRAVATARLPDEYVLDDPGLISTSIKSPPPEIEVALWNLV